MRLEGFEGISKICPLPIWFKFVQKVALIKYCLWVSSFQLGLIALTVKLSVNDMSNQVLLLTNALFK